jgi:hypothetical protein
VGIWNSSLLFYLGNPDCQGVCSRPTSDRYMLTESHNFK